MRPGALTSRAPGAPMRVFRIGPPPRCNSRCVAADQLIEREVAHHRLAEAATIRGSERGGAHDADLPPEGELDVTAGVHKYGYRANWKFQIENGMDGYHPNFVRQTYFDNVRRRTGAKLTDLFSSQSSGRTLDLGNGHVMLDCWNNPGRKMRAGMPTTPWGREYHEKMIAKHGEERTARILSGGGTHMRGFANLILIGVQIRTIRPVKAACRPIAAVRKRYRRRRCWNLPIENLYAGRGRIRIRDQDGFRAERAMDDFLAVRVMDSVGDRAHQMHSRIDAKRVLALFEIMIEPHRIGVVTEYNGRPQFTLNQIERARALAFRFASRSGSSVVWMRFSGVVRVHA